MGNFRDILVDREANKLISDFLARKIRQRVTDPAVAEKLIPKITASARRVPLESGYFEVYNQPNVTLVDINETPIERITPTGIKTSDAEYAFDIIIYATGFDAITGAFDRIDFRGVDGVSLKEKWQDGPQTFLGILVDGFPNMLMVMGPHAGLGNFPRAAEYSADWVTRLIRFARDRGLTRIEATAAGANAWTDHVIAASEGLLFTEVDSWMTGINRNVEGKQVRRIMRYSGGHPAFRALRSGGGGRVSRAGVGVALVSAAACPDGERFPAGRNDSQRTSWRGAKRRAISGNDAAIDQLGWGAVKGSRPADTTNQGALHACRHDDGVRQLRLGELPRRARVGRGDPAGPARRRSRFRLPVVGRAPFNDYSFVPDNLQLMTYLTALCPGVDLGTAAVIVPWHDPLRVAEQAAVLDMLSKGRLRLGLGAAWRGASSPPSASAWTSRASASTKRRR